MSKKYYKTSDCGNRIRGLNDLILEVEKAYMSDEDAKEGKVIFVTEEHYKKIKEEIVEENADEDKS